MKEFKNQLEELFSWFAFHEIEITISSWVEPHLYRALMTHHSGFECEAECKTFDDIEDYLASMKNLITQQGIKLYMDGYNKRDKT